MKYLLLALLLPATASAQTLADRVPDLDGTFDPGDQITRIEIIDGGTAISVRTVPAYVTHLCIAAEETILVLHASAALGSAKYQKVGDQWWLVHGFEWDLRDTAVTDSTIQKRRDYLEREGWVATTQEMGTPGQTEFLVSDRLLAPGARWAVAVMPAESPENILGFEGADAEGCARHPLVAGPPPPQVDFRPGLWRAAQ